MILSGENYILTPKVQELSFVFENVTVSTTGLAEVGFSGDGKTFSFLFSGGKVSDPSRNFTYTLNPGENITISGDYDGSKYRYSIDEELSSDGENRQGFATEKFYAKTQDCEVTMGLVMQCPTIDYTIETDAQFVAGGVLGGRIINASHIGFDVLSSELIQEGYVKNFTGIVEGEVLPLGALDFELWDVSDLVSVNNADATLKLKTTIGDIEHDIIATRTSGFIGNMANIIPMTSEPFISPYFSGSGDHRGFTWLPYTTEEQTWGVGYELYGEDGENLEKPLYVSLENVSPADQTSFTGVYIASYFTYDSGSHYCTGEDVGCYALANGVVYPQPTNTTETACTETNGICSDTSYISKTTCLAAGKVWTAAYIWGPLSDICKGTNHGSGSYSGVPSVDFVSYSNVTGTFFNKNNIFSPNTPDKIPMLFSGYEGEGGAGASGYFLTEPFQLNVGVEHGGDGINWKRISGYEMTNLGTGYTKMPAVFATTGIAGMLKDGGGNPTIPVMSGFTTATDPNGYGTGYDLAYSSNVFTYQKFAATSYGDPEAEWLTGLSYFVESGNGVYGLSGIIITNPGSGYNQTTHKPTIKVVRDAGDTLGSRGFCSDAQYPTRETCEDAGVCSDTTWLTKYQCEAAGTCSNSNYNNDQLGCDTWGGTWTPANNTWTATPKVWTDGGDNLSGEFFFNKTKRTYDFATAWNIETGSADLSNTVGVNFRDNNLISNNKYSSISVLAADEDQFYIRVYFDNLDIDQAIESKLTISGDGLVEEIPLSILNTYSYNTGMAYYPNNVLLSDGGGEFAITYFS